MTIIYNRTALRERRKQLRNNPTETEAMLWQKLKGRRLLGVKFRRQYSVDAYVIDFYCPELKLAIEIDGSSHDSAEARQYDKQRQKCIEECGIAFLRFRNDEVKNEIDAVVKRLSTVINEKKKG